MWSESVRNTVVRWHLCSWWCLVRKGTDQVAIKAGPYLILNASSMEENKPRWTTTILLFITRRIGTVGLTEDQEAIQEYGQDNIIKVYKFESFASMYSQPLQTIVKEIAAQIIPAGAGGVGLPRTRIRGEISGLRVTISRWGHSRWITDALQ